MMKKLPTALFVAGTMLFTACDKDDVIQPTEKVQFETEDSRILCAGCGDWDITGRSGSGLRSTSSDTTLTPVVPKKRNEKHK